MFEADFVNRVYSSFCLTRKKTRSRVFCFKIVIFVTNMCSDQYVIRVYFVLLFFVRLNYIDKRNLYFVFYKYSSEL